MSMICSSLYRHSLGVDCGIIRMRLMTLSSIVLSFLVCAFVGVQVSLPYVIMGIMHVSSSVQIVCMAIPLKCSSPAMYRAVCSADSTFPSICCMCLSRVFFEVMVSPRYL